MKITILGSQATVSNQNATVLAHLNMSNGSVYADRMNSQSQNTTFTGSQKTILNILDLNKIKFVKNQDAFKKALLALKDANYEFNKLDDGNKTIIQNACISREVLCTSHQESTFMSRQSIKFDASRDINGNMVVSRITPDTVVIRDATNEFNALLGIEEDEDGDFSEENLETESAGAI